MTRLTEATPAQTPAAFLAWRRSATIRLESLSPENESNLTRMKSLRDHAQN